MTWISLHYFDIFRKCCTAKYTIYRWISRNSDSKNSESDVVACVIFCILQRLPHTRNTKKPQAIPWPHNLRSDRFPSRRQFLMRTGACLHSSIRPCFMIRQTWALVHHWGVYVVFVNVSYFCHFEEWQKCPTLTNASWVPQQWTSTLGKSLAWRKSRDLYASCKAFRVWCNDCLRGAARATSTQRGTGLALQ